MRDKEEKSLKKLIIVPAYNEEASIEKTVELIRQEADFFDYVVINDCSTDRTGEICEARGYPVVNLPTNLGIGGAVQTGYRYALRNGYEMAVQVDGDGQHDPKFLKQMAEYLEENGLDMVIGSRFIERQGFQSSAMRRAGIRFSSALIRLLTGARITDPTSGLRIIGKDVLKLFAGEYPKDYPEPESVVTVLGRGFQVGEVPVVMKERNGGKSSISPGKSVYYMIKVSLAILFEKMRKE